MKILKVSIKNLNSLQAINKQPQIIDFQDERIAAEGLFAITGSTGAGKTTILDAITLALYGKTAREHQKDVMTYGTMDCFAEIEFEINQKQYRAKWYQEKKGKTIDSKTYTKHEIATLPDNRIIGGHRLKETQEKIEKIIGLTYEQFTRAVMLVQGDFAKFLKAKKGEKVELLEKMTGTERYSLISTKTYERNDIEKNKLYLLEDKLKDLKLLTDEEIKHLNLMLKQFEQQHQTINNELNSTNNQIRWLDNLERLLQQKQGFEVKLAILQKEKEQQQPTFDLLVLHHKAIGFKEALTEVKRLENEIKDIDNQLLNKENELKKIITNLTKQNEAFEAATIDFNSLKASEADKNALFEEIIILDNEITSKAKPIIENQKILKIEQENLEESKSQLTTDKDNLIDWQQKHEKANNWLLNNDIDKNIKNDLSDIKININTINQQKEDLEKAEKIIKSETNTFIKSKKNQEKMTLDLEKIIIDLTNHKNNFSSLYPNTENQAIAIKLVEKGIDFGQKSIDDLKTFIFNTIQFNADNEVFKSLQHELLTLTETQKNLTIELVELQHKIPVFTEKFQDKLRIYELEQRMQDYEDIRKNLKEGEPCPLCFSKNHNLDYHYDISKAEKEKITAEKSLNELKKELTTCEINTKNNANLNEKQKLKLVEFERKIKQFDTVLQSVAIENKRLFHSISGVEGLQDKLKSLEDALKNEKEKLDELRKLNNLIIEFNRLKIEKESDLNQVKSSLDYSQKTIDNQNLIKVECGQKVNNATLQLNSILEKYQLTTNTPELLLKLNNRAKYYDNAKRYFDKAVHEIDLLIQKINNAETQQKNTQKRIDDLIKNITEHEQIFNNLKLKRIQLFGSKDLKTAQEKFKNELNTSEALITSLRAFVFDLKTKKSNLETSIHDFIAQRQKSQTNSILIINDLQTKITASGFLDFDAVEKAWLSEKQKKEIEAEEKRLHEANLKFQQSLDDTNIEVQKERKKELTKKEKITLQNDFKNLEVVQKDIFENIGKTKKEIEINTANQVEAVAQKIKIAAQMEICKRWKLLNDLIGSKNGKKFQAFVQDLTLNQLVNLANTHLKQLNKRYYIEKDNENADTLDLFVIDTDQANTKRPMSTLSGGESFLVSLALALGLSDLAGQNTNIESLFIDEGFGTLDEETLRDAIYTLKNLNHSGKTIGIISHVPALKKEITTQIRVTKKGSGVSVLELV